MNRKAFVLLLGMAPLAAVPLAAQTPLRVGESVAGTLESSDPRLGGVPYDAYTIRGQPGERIVARMHSQEFDTYLRWGREENGEWVESAGNDDGGEGTDSRLVVMLGGDGEYELRAGAFAEENRGAYTLELAALAPPRPAPLRVGERIAGTLAESDYEAENGLEDHYILAGNPGDVVTVFMTSEEFDPFVSVGRWTDGDFDVRASDDDSGTGTNAQLVVRMDGSEAYVVVRSFFGDQGAYTLWVEPGAAPPVEEEEVEVDSDLPIDLGDVPPDAGVDAGSTVFHETPAIGTFEGPVGADGAAEGTLGDGDDPEDGAWYYREYSIRARAGERLTIHAESEDLDTYVGIGRGRGEEFEPLAEDDDGGEDLDSRLEFEVPEAGVYTIRVTSAGPGQTGRFALRVERGR